jgi:hypothetical protein
MKLQEYKDTPQEIKHAAFVQARKDWLSILLHDWFSGEHDEHIDNFLAAGVDIFQTPDAEIARGFGIYVYKVTHKE